MSITDENKNKMWYIRTMEYYSLIKKKEMRHYYMLEHG